MAEAEYTGAAPWFHTGTAIRNDGTISTIWPTCSGWSRTGIYTGWPAARSAQPTQRLYDAPSSGSVRTAVCTSTTGAAAGSRRSTSQWLYKWRSTLTTRCLMSLGHQVSGSDHRSISRRGDTHITRTPSLVDSGL